MPGRGKEAEILSVLLTVVSEIFASEELSLFLEGYMSLEDVVVSMSWRMLHQPRRQNFKGDTASYMGDLFRVLKQD